VSQNLEGSAPRSPNEREWWRDVAGRTVEDVCTSRPDCQCLFCDALRARESPRDALQRLAREYVAVYVNK
jgi:hypothetical protein